MSGLARYVSRKVAATVVAFAALALVAAGVVGLARASGSGTPSGAVGLSSSLSDADALSAALDDPGSVVGGSTDETGAREGVVAAGSADSGWQRLRADLVAARALSGDGRRAALADIRSKARAGEYGAAVQRRAERRQVRHELLVSLLPDNLQSDLTALKNAPADQRPELRSQILDHALAGDYGPEVQHAAEQLRAVRKG